jgi:hypothetical protein
MARVGRLAGAILAESEGHYYLVGQTKVPCDWARAGFEPPGELDPTRRPFVRLARLASHAPIAPMATIASTAPGAPAPAVDLGSPCLALSLEGEDLARALGARLLVERNGSVSERLWRLVVHGGVDPDDDPSPGGVGPSAPDGAIDARWLGEIPQAVWQIVRDTVLRCV